MCENCLRILEEEKHRQLHMFVILYKKWKKLASSSIIQSVKSQKQCVHSRILLLKNVSPPKRVVCFILSNLHFPIVKGIAFFALYKSRVLIICLFIYRVTRWNLKKVAWYRYPILKLFCGVTLRKHYIIKATYDQ